MDFYLFNFLKRYQKNKNKYISLLTVSRCEMVATGTNTEGSLAKLITANFK